MLANTNYYAYLCKCYLKPINKKDMRKKNLKNWAHHFAHTCHNEAVKDLFEWTQEMKEYRARLTEAINEIRHPYNWQKSREFYKNQRRLIDNLKYELAIAKANIQELSMQCRVNNMEIREYSKLKKN